MGEDRRLPLRVAPEADETLVGFLVRLAARNGWPDVPSFSRAVGVPFQQVHDAQYQPFDLAPLARAAGTDCRKLERLAYWPRGRRLVGFLGHELDAQFLTAPRERRTCPVCLAAIPRHRAIWDLTVSSFCGRHHVPLVSACPRCSIPLGWKGPSIDLCRCGFRLADIRQFENDPASTAGIAAITASFESWRPGKGVSGPVLSVAALDPAERLLLTLQTGWCASGRAGFAHPYRLPVGEHDLSRFLEAGHAAVRGWPDTFRNLLADLNAMDLHERRRRRRGSPRGLGPLLRWARTLDRATPLGSLLGGELDRMPTGLQTAPGKTPRRRTLPQCR